MATTKQARDEKRAAEKAAADHKRVLDYKASVARQRAQPVVGTSHDLFAMSATSADPLFGREREQELLYNMLSLFERMKERLAQELAWLRRAVEDAEREAESGAVYSSNVVGARGNDVDAAHNGVYTAAEAARAACRFVGVYCPALNHRVDNAARALRLSLRVLSPQAFTHIDDGATYWVVRDADGDVPEALATAENPQGKFATEDAAWRAFAALVGDTI